MAASDPTGVVIVNLETLEGDCVNPTRGTVFRMINTPSAKVDRPKKSDLMVVFMTQEDYDIYVGGIGNASDIIDRYKTTNERQKGIITRLLARNRLFRDALLTIQINPEGTSVLADVARDALQEADKKDAEEPPNGG